MMHPRGAAADARRRVYVHTFGCQMNVYDSDRMVDVLRPSGYEATDDPEQADVILLNTCSVRDKAHHKVLSALGTYRRIKARRGDVVLGVGGCVGTQEGERLLRKVPYLDIVFGPDTIARLPDLVEQARQRRRVADAGLMDRKQYAWLPIRPPRDGQVTAMLTVMKGCNKFCSFCIVPLVRGREVSKPPERVVDEVRQLAEAGVREVTLLGQNVNSYGRDLQRGKGPRFADLLEMVHEVPGIARIRFTTSHPWDCSDRLIGCFDGHLPRLCEWFHLPVQSGDDAILAAMRRGYTVEHYCELVDRLRQTCPDIALTTDIIVGFPGETDAQFARTLALLERVRFDRIFAFAYSERPGTAACRLQDDVAPEVKADRLRQVFQVQARITADRMRKRFEGRVVEVLVEGPSRGLPAAAGGGRDVPQLGGRTRTNVPVHFPAPEHPDTLRGRLVHVRVERVLEHSLVGRLVGDVGEQEAPSWQSR